MAAFGLGKLLQRQGDLEEALTAYRRADELGHAEAADLVGWFLETSGDLDAARRAYARAEERAGPLMVGLQREGRGDLDGAARAYARAADLGRPEAAYLRGQVLEKQGCLTEAARAYERLALSSDSNWAELASGKLDLLRRRLPH